MKKFRKITTDVLISSPTTFEDEILVFEGGQFINNNPAKTVTLTGNNTKIIAPPYQIFVGEFKFEGTWVMDRAYPQWFGAVAYPDIAAASAEDAISSTDAINKAIKFKNGGEVFIPKGVYLITNTSNTEVFDKGEPVYAGINMTTGIDLVGEKGGVKDKFDKRTVFVVKFDTSKIATDYPDNPSNFALLININKSDATNNAPTWRQPNSTQGYTVKNIFFYNSTPIYGKNKLLRCVLCGCGATFDCNVWRGFSQAVKYLNIYIDDRKVVNCEFNLNKDTPEYNPDDNDKLYAFDMGSLGDATLFEHNQINDGYKNKGLRLNNCGGASINANVLNADVLITSCKGITFVSNHLEQGRQMVITSSNVTSLNNYFMRGEKPAIVINGTRYQDKSVVTSNGDNFIFYDNLFFEGKEITYYPVCEYDIAIDQYSVLNISNAYRYWHSNGFGKMYTCGIKMLKILDPENIDDAVPFDDFNKHSYALSQSGIIRAGHKIGSEFPIESFDQSNNFYYMANGGVKWDYDTGYYTYHCQIVWDADRGLIWTKNGQSLIRMGNYGHGNTVYNTKGGNGILFILGRNGLNFNLRLIRTRYSDSACTNAVEMHFIDVPICGTVNIYDNGLSISGFGWNKVQSGAPLPVISGNTGLAAATFNGGNVVCYSSNNATQGSGWKTGDMIINTGSLSSWTIKVVK